MYQNQKNSSIKGRSYLKHLFIYLFIFLKFLSHLQMLAHKKNNNKAKKKKNKNRREKKEKKKKKIKTNMVQLLKALLEFT